MKVLKSLFESQKARHQRARATEIGSTFSIKEKDGSLWIIHNGYAIQKIDKNQTAEEIVTILNNYRSTAIQY